MDAEHERLVLQRASVGPPDTPKKSRELVASLFGLIWRGVKLYAVDYKQLTTPILSGFRTSHATSLPSLVAVWRLVCHFNGLKNKNEFLFWCNKVRNLVPHCHLNRRRSLAWWFWRSNHQCRHSLSMVLVYASAVNPQNQGCVAVSLPSCYDSSIFLRVFHAPISPSLPVEVALVS